MNEQLAAQERELHAYVDGELDPETMAHVEARLARDPEARQRVADYRLQRDMLQDLHRGLLDKPIPPQMTRILRRSPRRVSTRFWQAAAGIVLVLGGAFAGWLGGELHHEASEAVEYLVEDTASAYRVYGPEVKHAVEVDGANRDHLQTWLSKRLEQPVQIPNLDTHGYRLLGGRLLATTAGPGALSLYEAQDGRRLVVYQCRNTNDERPSRPLYQDEDGVAVYYWFQNGLALGVAGASAITDLDAITESVYRQTGVRLTGS